MNHRYLQKFQIKDVVFLAIMSAVALATCAVMPLVISLQPLIFGISQLVTALQIGDTKANSAVNQKACRKLLSEKAFT